MDLYLLLGRDYDDGTSQEVIQRETVPLGVVKLRQMNVWLAVSLNLILYTERLENPFSVVDVWGEAVWFTLFGFYCYGNGILLTLLF